MVKSKSPIPAKPATENLIPIEIKGRVAAGKKSSHTDPFKFWSEYYRKHDESSLQLRETLALLNVSEKFGDLHAAIVAYLTQRPKNREPWMYEALAMAIELNKGKPEEIKTALNYAADLAQRTHNPNHLVSVADKMMLKGFHERIGPLLDEAIEKLPHRAEPLMMSINLAQKTKDPKRMADSINKLLSLGWLGNDEYMRRESRVQAERLAKTLREEGETAEAQKLLDSLPAAEARDVYIRLRWDGDADYDLTVEEPLGAKAEFAMPRTVFGGSLIKNGYGKRPEEIYVCPRGFDGNYIVRIATVYASEENPPTRLTLETITHEGTEQEKKELKELDPAKLSDQTIVVQLSQGRRTTVLPFLSPEGIVDSAPLLVDPSARSKEKEKKDARAGESTPSPADAKKAPGIR